MAQTLVSRHRGGMGIGYALREDLGIEEGR
jgi:hypothetical protein